MTTLTNLELYFHHAPAADLTELAGPTVNTTGMIAGMIIQVIGEGQFHLQLPAVKTPDGVDVIAGYGGGGVWLRSTVNLLDSVDLNIKKQTVFNGLEDASLFAVSHDPLTRVFTVTYTAGAEYTVNGARYAPAAGPVVTSPHADVSGKYFLYYNSAGTLTVSNSPWDLLTTAPLSYIYYNTSNDGGAAASIEANEKHSGHDGMAPATHKNLHLTRGTQLLSGCIASGYSIGDVGANLAWTTSAGVVADEDNELSVASQPLGGANNYRILWLTGPEGNPTWNWKDVAEYGVYTDGTEAYYNQNNGGTYQLTSIVANNTWVNYYSVASTAQLYPQIIVIMGQNTYLSEDLALAASFSDDCAFFSDFTPEGVILNKATYRRRTGNPFPGRLELTDFVKISQSLIAIGTGGAVNASEVVTSTTDFNNFFNVGDTDVQTCLDALDDGLYPEVAGANRLLMSNNFAPPEWSTATYPRTTTGFELLYSAATNVVAGLATVNSGVVATSLTGHPFIAGPMTNGQMVIGSTGATPTANTLTEGTGITITNGAGSIDVSIDKSGYYITTCVIFDGVGLTVVAGFNVSSVTRRGTGLYYVNFTTSYPSTSMVPFGMSIVQSAVDYNVFFNAADAFRIHIDVKTAYAGVATDIAYIPMAVSFPSV